MAQKGTRKKSVKVITADKMVKEKAEHTFKKGGWMAKLRIQTNFKKGAYDKLKKLYWDIQQVRPKHHCCEL